MEYPEHEKLKKNKEFHSHVSDFLEWCEIQGYELCKIDQERAANALTYIPYISFRPDKVIAEFFGIDAKKLESEKQEMIANLR